jgi:N-acetylglucosaminyldiphosphoundecaprenol N-acetyl-beta-D-mannosaminyltransferase
LDNKDFKSKETIELFGIRINPLDRASFSKLAEESLRAGVKIVNNGVNAAVINEVRNNPGYRDILSRSDLINIDGMSVVWALRFLGFRVPERVACPDLAEDLLLVAAREQYGVYLFGASEDSVIKCRRNLEILFPGLVISGTRNGFFSENDLPDIVSDINRSGAKILLLGMPSPRKEKFADMWRNELNATYIFGVGGLFDIYSGLTKRAPLWMQKTGLEWFYRFIQEPRRMWNRYFYGNISFIFSIIREKIRRKNN